jgi:hypothetical protein
MANTYITNTITSPYTGAGVTLNTGAGVAGLNGLNSYTIASGSITNASFNTSSQNFVSNQGKPIMTVPANGQTVVLEKAATLEVKGNVVINGLDLEERLKTIERLLLIPERDVTMEAKYPSLKKTYDEYINKLEKYRTFERIKGDEDGTT